MAAQVLADEAEELGHAGVDDLRGGAARDGAVRVAEVGMERDALVGRDAAQRGLAGLALPLQAHVNLIPLNDVEEYKYKPSEQSTMNAFRAILEENGVNVTVRRRLGKDIDASCGQLRRNYEKEKELT